LTSRLNAAPSWRGSSSWPLEAGAVWRVSDLNLRPLATFREAQACVKLQEEVWGQGYSERVPAALLLLANRLDGLTAGAFDPRGELQGFVFGLPGRVDGVEVHWSDTLAVRQELRDRGLGTRLKLYQRDVLLDRGVRRMHWTFDPLQSRNAHVNFTKLGITCREYARDLYGDTGSPLHRGVGTDRMVATWDMDSRRVRGRLEGFHAAPQWRDVLALPRAVEVREGEGFVEPSPAVLELDHPRLLVPVPVDSQEMTVARLPLAVRWREVTREAFLHYLSRGYQVREFVRGEQASGYVLVGPGSSEGSQAEGAGTWGEDQGEAGEGGTERGGEDEAALNGGGR
jgi:chorismate synthase